MSLARKKSISEQGKQDRMVMLILLNTTGIFSETTKCLRMHWVTLARKNVVTFSFRFPSFNKVLKSCVFF